MTKTPTASQPLERAMRLLGRRWGLQLVYYLLNGPKRFSDLEKDIPRISQRMLAFNLKKFEEAGLVTRTVVPTFPIKIEYELTSEGMELQSVIVFLHRWAEKLPHVISANDAVDTENQATSES